MMSDEHYCLVLRELRARAGISRISLIFTPSTALLTYSCPRAEIKSAMRQCCEISEEELDEAFNAMLNELQRIITPCDIDTYQIHFRRAWERYGRRLRPKRKLMV